MITPIPRHDDPPSRLALIDLGSNTALMSVLFGNPSEPRRLRIAEELQIITGLGRERGADGRLNPAARARVLSALSHFAGRIDAMGVPPSAVLGATTAAMREATDGKTFLTEISQQTGIDLRLIPGETEAELVALAQERSFPGRLPLLVVDIGGGSTEVALRERGRTAWKISTPIGTDVRVISTVTGASAAQAVAGRGLVVTSGWGTRGSASKGTRAGV